MHRINEKKENHPFRLNRNISTLDKQIKSKVELIQKVIDKKHALRQTYLEAMEDARKSESNQESRIQSSQQDFISAMDRLDEEEEVFSLEKNALIKQKSHMDEAISSNQTILFFPKKTTWTLIILILLALSSGLLILQMNPPADLSSPKEALKT